MSTRSRRSTRRSSHIDESIVSSHLCPRWRWLKAQFKPRCSLRERWCKILGYAHSIHNEDLRLQALQLGSRRLAGDRGLNDRKGRGATRKIERWMNPCPTAPCQSSRRSPFQIRDFIASFADQLKLLKEVRVLITRSVPDYQSSACCVERYA